MRKQSRLECLLMFEAISCIFSISKGKRSSLYLNPFSPQFSNPFPPIPQTNLPFSSTTRKRNKKGGNHNPNQKPKPKKKKKKKKPSKQISLSISLQPLFITHSPFLLPQLLFLNLRNRRRRQRRGGKRKKAAKQTGA